MPVTYIAEIKTRNDMVDAPTVILDKNKLLELHSADEFRDFVNKLYTNDKRSNDLRKQRYKRRNVFK